MLNFARPRVAWSIIGLLVAIVVVFFVIRLVVDVPHLLAGTSPAPSEFAYRYVANAVLAYAHIVPGVVYLLLAPIQLWRGFRNRHLRWHRRIGRVAITAGLMSGVFAILFGGLHAFGGVTEAAAAVVFGAWFITCLVICLPSHPPPRRDAPSTLDDPRVRGGGGGRHDPHLDRPV